MSASKLTKLYYLPPMPSLSDLVKLYKLRAIRQLSQNFLLDKNVNDKIVRQAEIKNGGLYFQFEELSTTQKESLFLIIS